MVAYLDSSVVLRYILLGDTALHHAMAFPRLVSSELLEIECRRTINRCRLQNELGDDTLVQALDRLDQLLQMVDLIELDGPIKQRAMASFPVVVKTLDALHLATAQALAAEEAPAGLQVFSYDKAMNLCARALGFGTPLATG
ncbi:MAG: PIN domain-containing protein [Spirochaetes bacterium]|nr:PIN domain-containing protein [Spirochaetota bacterium]MBU0955941.1 PIN domain-containing protein [Spirochaetota bacterium]